MKTETEKKNRNQAFILGVLFLFILTKGLRKSNFEIFHT